MPNCYLKTLKWSYNRIKNRDIFKQTISLTYKGKDNFSNIVGGAATLLMLLILLGYSITLLRTMFRRTDVSWNLNTIRTNNAEDDSKQEWTKDDPRFKIFWTTYHSPQVDADDMGKAFKAYYSHEYLERNLTDLNQITYEK